MAEFFCTLKFFFGDWLTWDDVLDWHNEILPLSRLPQGGEAKTNLKSSLALETQHVIRQKRSQAHTLSIWTCARRVEGQTDTPINHANQGEVPTKTLPISPKMEKPKSLPKSALGDKIGFTLNN